MEPKTEFDEKIIAEQVRAEALEAQIRELQAEYQNCKKNLQQLREWAWQDQGFGPDDDAACYTYEKHLMRMGHYMRGVSSPWTTGAAARKAGED